MLRLFVAVDLPASEQQAVAALCTDVRGARWVKPHQLHITLRFMGQTPDEDLPAIRQRLALVEAPSFHLALHDVGVFPAPAQKPRVLWLGLAPPEPLVRLKREIDRALLPHPQEEKREFSPHLTLARLSGKPDESLSHFLAQHGNHRGPDWPVAGFRLYQSTLRSSGAVHELLATYALPEICRQQ
jgi:2'-5' RNA ligase